MSSNSSNNSNNRFIVSPFSPGRDHPFLNDDQLYRVVDTENRVPLPGCSENKELMEKKAKKKNDWYNRLAELRLIENEIDTTKYE